MIRQRFFLCLLSLAAVLVVEAQTSFGNARKWNTGWRFVLADEPNAQSPQYDDAKWETLTLPHDWGVTQPMSPDRGSCQGYLPGGIGWYRLHFTPDAADVAQGRRLFVYFEGVYNYSTVYLNGQKLGERPSGFASFIYDLTPYLRAGEDNVLAVRVNHSKQDDSRWYTGSGIYRNVWLVSAPDVHLALWGSAWKLTTPTQKVREGKACEVEVAVATTDERDAAQAAQAKSVRYEAVVDIVDAEGAVVASTKTNVTIGTPKSVKLTVPHARLWSLQTPYLYQVRTRLLADGVETDRAQVPMGLRTLEFSPDHGFALNGQWMKVKGVCLHDDAGVLGTAVPSDVWRTRLQTLKQIGVNAIRMSHNPHAPVVYDLCDSIGLLVMDEASDEWEFPKRKWLKGWNRGKPGYEGTYEYFEEWIDRDVADMVRRDRCHPSIFLWSIGNEVDYPNDPYSHPVLNGDNSMTQPVYGGYKPEQPNAERIGEIAKRLAAIVRGIDASRAVTGALAGVVMSNETAYPEAVDVVGYNYTESRYGEDHKKYPKRVIYGSENRHDMNAWKAVRDNEHIFGQFLWTGIDYLGESGPWPARGSEAGLLNLAGQVKPLGWYRASLWSETPVCYIGTYAAGRPNTRNYRGRENREWVSQYATATWNYRTGQRVRVVCYTNADDARLLLNGTPVGGTPTRDEATGILYWDIDYAPGTLRCEAGGAASEIRTCGRPYALRAVVDKTSLGGEDVAQVTIEVVDEDGNIVNVADNEVTCRVQGMGVRLLGMENGDIRDTRDKTQPRCRVHGGRLVAYLAKDLRPRNAAARQRPFDDAAADNLPQGEIRVAFSSPLLETAEITLTVK
ncbi:MAG: DUF4982 domain-containing protein [Prevotellaceae bacterium]|nr:DUF4982 domain-containing protein [Prevotellaceae bacterium]